MLNVQTGRPSVFPFVAIVGQEQMKLALTLIAVYPAIGGLLIRGQKGTAKSTAVRGLAELLPGDDGENSKHFVDLPLGATEDMVVGTIDFEAAIRYGESRFLPGLLHRAHGGILYVDEVNLLDDHLVDCILDAAESGVNRVEREGLRVQHPSRFALIGSMNPEEGELRPQLLDRFGLAIQVSAEDSADNRVQLVRQRERFDRINGAFVASYHPQTEALAQRIASARKRVQQVKVPSYLLGFISEICRSNNVAGHRADISIERAARAHAAWLGNDQVSAEDIQQVAPMALLHRARQGTPPDLPPPPPPPEDDLEQDHPEEQNENQPDRDSEPPEPQSNDDGQDRGEQQQAQGDRQESRPAPAPEKPRDRTADEHDGEVWEIGQPFRVRSLTSEKDHKLRTGSGRRSRSRCSNKHGRYVRSTTLRRNNDLALDATLRAAAPFQLVRRKTSAPSLAVHIRESDIREKIRERRMGNVLLFTVDGSGSMGAQKRMVETKAAIMSLLVDAYQKRDRVALTVFRGCEAEVVLPPTNSIELSSKLLAQMPIGGRTPLSAGLCRTAELIEQVRRKDPLSRPIVLLLTDGKANAAIGDKPAHIEALEIAVQMQGRYPFTRFIVVDTEPPGAVRLKLAQKLAVALGADYFEPQTLRAQQLIDLVKENY
ncbi:MAG: ATP-binding protein [Deltaproteobacteria bacterium]|nr:ATP-binding protein [Deltaproteobacteria bacterium]